MCISPAPAGESPPQEPSSWLPRAALPETHWAPLLRACLNRVTPTNCEALAGALRAAVGGSRATRAETVPSLVSAVLAHVSLSGLYGPQNAALCGALASLAAGEGADSFLEGLMARCEEAALGAAPAERAVRRRCAAFLGELHTAGVTPPDRVAVWLRKLQPEDAEEETLDVAQADRIDCLCALLATAGAALDVPLDSSPASSDLSTSPSYLSSPYSPPPASSPASDDPGPHLCLSPASPTPAPPSPPSPPPAPPSRLDELFSRLSALSASPALDTRLRCLLLDTIELRGRGWRQRAHVARPVHIEELRAAAAAETAPRTGRRRRGRRQQRPSQREETSGQ